MELTKNFKKTEFGDFPKQWDIKTIQSLIEDNSITGHLDGNHGELYPRSDEFKEDGIPYITANDLTGAKVDFSHCKYLSPKRASTFKKGIAKMVMYYLHIMQPLAQQDYYQQTLIM